MAPKKQPPEIKSPLVPTLRNLERYHGRKAVEAAIKEYLALGKEKRS